jgi:hypothetical protein
LPQPSPSVLQPQALPSLLQPPAEQPAPSATPPRSAPAPSSRVEQKSARAPVAPEGFAPEELELIAAARTALAERRFDAAGQHAARHAARFPRGAFSEEREAILALSECRSQRGSERGQRFVSERPASLLAERVRRDCGLGANLVPGTGGPDTH